MRDPLPHILIVDDDPSIREALDAALTGSYVVHTVARGAEASAILRSHPIAAIILDVVLHEENGLDLIKGFRAISPAPILVLTGYGTEDLAVRALRLKASDYLKKPFNLDELLTSLARMVPPVQPPADPVERARLHLEEHLGKDVDLDDLAAQVALSERHFRRRFHQTHGIAPRRYFTEGRLQRAADMLCTTDESIGQIAGEVGHSDLRWFRRLFKRRFGMSPSEYRLGQDRQPNRDATNPLSQGLDGRNHPPFWPK